MAHHPLRKLASDPTILEQISKMGLRLRGKHQTSQCGKRDRRRGLLFEKMEDRRLLTVIDLATLAPDQGSIIYGAEAGDKSGYAVSSAGDVNGDGFDDLLIAATSADGANNLRPDAGEAYVVFGSASPSPSLDLASLGSAGITIFGAEAGRGLNQVSGAGDVNGDGFDDLLIGRSYGDGKVYLILGGASLPQTIDLGSLGSAGITISGAGANGFSGVGDVNADGIDDFLIGASTADNYAGASYLIFGGSSLPAPGGTIDLGNLVPGSGLTIHGIDAGDQSGSRLSGAGDVNGDGYGDLLIGAQLADGAGNLKSDAGECYVIFGGPSLTTTASIDLATLGSAGITLFGVDTGDRMGGVSSADVNGDGFDDLLIAATANADGNLKPGAGETYIVFGSNAPPETIDMASLGSAGVTIFGADAGDSGNRKSVRSAGDVNGDGFDDILVGAFLADGPGNSRNVAGESYLIFGNASLPTTIDLANLGIAGVTIFGADAGDKSGFATSGAGDVNGDGFDDLLIGSVGAAAFGNNKELAGESYLIFGRANFASPMPSVSIADATAHEGTTLEFTVSLSSASAEPITLNYGTTDATALSGVDYLSTSGMLTFEPGQLTKTVLVSTLEDSTIESNETFVVFISNAIGASINDHEALGTIEDNDLGPSTKFYVVNDGGSDRTYEYDATGAAIESQPLDAGNTAPRGVAMTAAGDKTWVIDANHTVYVYDTSGNVLGSWLAKGLSTKAVLEGIATDGIDVWLVDAKTDQVFRYAGAATRTNSFQNATSSFSLASGNAQPKGIVTDGSYLWVVNDANSDKVFKYTLAGVPLGNWKLNTSGASSPTGITIDPTGASQSIWIVDSGTDKVYEYSDARARTSGKQSAAANPFSLAAGNTNPQGIADPPPPGGSSQHAVRSTPGASVSTMAPPLAANSHNTLPSLLERDDQPHELIQADAHDQRPSRYAAPSSATGRNQLLLASETHQPPHDSTGNKADDVFSGDENFDAFDDALLGLLALQR